VASNSECAYDALATDSLTPSYHGMALSRGRLAMRTVTITKLIDQPGSVIE